MIDIIDGYRSENNIFAEDIGEYNISMWGDGDYVLPVGEQLAYELVSNNEIVIKDGFFITQGRRGVIKKGTTETCMIENGTQADNRNDLIVIEYERDAASSLESHVVKIIKGTAGEVAVDPEIITGNIPNGDLIHQMPLYRVRLEGLNVVAVEPMFEVGKISPETVDPADAEEEGLAADAKATGDALKNLGEQISNFESTKADIVGSNLGQALGMSTDDKWTDVVGDIEGVEVPSSQTASTYNLDTTNERVRFYVPKAGFWKTGNFIYQTYANIASLIGLTAAKLVSGNTILGIAGTGKKSGLNQLYYVQGSYVRTDFTVSFDLSFVEGYKSLTVDDIYLCPRHYKRYNTDGANRTYTYSYDASTGIFKWVINGNMLAYDEVMLNQSYPIIVKPKKVKNIVPISITRSELILDMTEFISTFGISSFKVSQVYLQQYGGQLPAGSETWAYYCTYDASTKQLTVTGPNNSIFYVDAVTANGVDVIYLDE